MFVIKKKERENYSLPVKEIRPDEAKVMGSKLAQRIMKSLVEKSKYAQELAQVLHEHEQKIYYHLYKLEEAGLIEVVKTAVIRGARTQYYGVVEPSFLVKFGEFKKQETAVYANESEFLMPFVKKGELHATIVVGSPDPHGPEKARSRDGYYGMDFALFLGTFLNRVGNLRVMLDTEVSSDVLKGNLIVFGGPIVNHTTKLLNKKMPVYYENKKFVSKLSGKSYDGDEIGIIVKMKNPFNKNKWVLVLAGKRFQGTRATILAFLQKFSELKKGNKHNKKVFAKVVEGVDTDYDGVVDSVEILE